MNNDPTIHKEFVRNLIQGGKTDHIQSVGAQHIRILRLKTTPG